MRHNALEDDGYIYYIVMEAKKSHGLPADWRKPGGVIQSELGVGCGAAENQQSRWYKS